jgi:hypothetical protein
MVEGPVLLGKDDDVLNVLNRSLPGLCLDGEGSLNRLRECGESERARSELEKLAAAQLVGHLDFLLD